MSNQLLITSIDQLNLVIDEHKIDLLRDVILLDETFHFVCFSSEFYSFFILQIKPSNQMLISEIKKRWRNAEYLLNAAIVRSTAISNFDFTSKESIEHYRFKTVVDADRVQQDWHDFSPLNNPFDHKTRWIMLLKENIIQKVVTEAGYNNRYLETAWRKSGFYQLQSQLHQISPRIGFEFSELLTYEFEKLAKVELADFTQAVRMVYLELIRISNHLKYLYINMLELEDPHYRPIKHLMESVDRLMIKINGQHGLNYTLMFGVVGHKIPIGWFNQCFELVRKIENFFVEMKDTFSSHFQKFNLLDSGYINYDHILHGGFSGPNLRSAGINWDHRINHHRYFYDELDFHAAIGIKSTSFDRLIVRMQEIIYSSQLIEQLTDNMPELTKRDTDFSSSTENHVWQSLREQNIPDNQLIHLSGEGSQGELHIFLKLNSAERKIQLERITTPSFMNFSLVSEIACNQQLEEFQLCYKTLGLCAWERDL
jgi:NADH-quinone oxidoreductase subunit D